MSLRLENSTDIFLELCLYANSEVFKIKALVYNTVIFVKQEYSFQQILSIIQVVDIFLLYNYTLRHDITAACRL